MKFKNINAALIPAICLACIIIMGCPGNVIPANNSSLNKTNQFTCPSNNSEEINAKLAPYTEGVNLPSVDWCYCINNTEGRDLCIGVTGGNGNDSSVCMRVNHTYYRDSCLSNVAANSGNASICEGIENQSMKQSCYAKVK